MADVSDFDRHMRQGKTLGLKDEQLVAYIQQCEERQERAEERRAADKEAERRFELERLKLQAHEQDRVDEYGQPVRREDGQYRPNTRQYPKLPMFKESVDSMDSFLCRFEAHAQAMQWPHKNWPMILSATLDGQALSLFHTMNTTGDLMYKDLKELLLIKFQCDAEGFRQKLRKATPEQGESFKSFGTRLAHLFQRWVELAEVEKTFDDLSDLICCEQFLASVSKDLAVFLRERNIKSIATLVENAEHYRIAHPTKCLARRTENQNNVTALAGSNPTLATAVAYNASRGRRQRQAYGPRNFSCTQRGAYSDKSTDAPRETGSSTDYAQRGNQYPNSGRGYRGFRAPKHSIDRTIKCTACDGYGHPSSTCSSVTGKAAQEENKSTLFCGSVKTTTTDVTIVTATAADYKDGKLEYTEGKVNNIPVTVVFDSGAVTAGVRKSLVEPHQYTGNHKSTWSFGGNKETFPLAIVPVETNDFKGNICCCVIEQPIIDLLIGNLEKVQPAPGLFGKVIEATNQPSPSLTTSSTEPETPTHQEPAPAAVTTRAQAKKDATTKKPLTSPQILVDHEELRQHQQNDDKLKPFYKHAETGAKLKINDSAHQFFEMKDNILTRTFISKNDQLEQIVVPTTLIHKVCFAAHDTLLSGHYSSGKTFQRIHQRFFWPRMRKDIDDYCKSCDACQRTQPKGKTRDIPLEFMPRIDVPFRRVAIDLVGPLHPPSDDKHTHILTIMDIATRYPEAIPLKKIDSVSVAEALFTVFARMGLPEEIHSDNGSQFTSDMMKEFHKLLAIKGVYSSPYHAQSNGVVERFHGTLKPMIRKVIQSQPRQWHRYVPALLFAVREMANASTGFSPFELLFGRQPRGTIDLLANAWTGGQDAPEAKTTYQHVIDLKTHIYDMCKIAHDAVDEARKTQKFHHDKKAAFRRFSVGDLVLLLLPTTANKLQMQWKGPYEVVEIYNNDYRIDLGNYTKVYHANMLKKYLTREQEQELQKQRTVTALAAETIAREQPAQQDFDTTECQPEQVYILEEIVSDDYCPQYAGPTCVAVLMTEDEDAPLSIRTLETQEIEEETALTAVHFHTGLDQDQVTEIKAAILESPRALNSKPGASTGTAVHEIRLTTQVPVRRKQYPLPLAARDAIIDEVQELLDLGIIEKSTSPYCSPIVLVPKKGTNKKRLCLDLRELNAITVFDAEPIPDPEEIFSRLADKKFFTKIDLAKGYYQLFIAEKDRHKTAFQTPLGLMQFKRVPFGLVSAPATFARAMRELLEDSAINFFDDILVASTTWREHVDHVKKVFKILQNGGFTAKPDKVFVGFTKLEFLGHIVGEGSLRPMEDKIRNILKIATPKTKKQVRSVLGTIGYYKKFVPNYATIVAPINDLLKGKPKGPINWTEQCHKALRKIQVILSSEPVLKLSDASKDFIVRTDASGVGIGGVLMQVHDGLQHPVSFASRKLLDRETRYSTIERECLGIVWTLAKFQRYLWGKPFLLETDHRPLQYLTSASFKNARIMRWSLSLQEFKYTIKALPGENNLFADIASRSEVDQDIPYAA